MNYKLNKLSQEVINQIAAGEVIERPASVVKELLDNSIDANAKRIVVKVKGGGMESIEISDDGFGIPKENMEYVFDAHTTSKLKSIEDLNTLLSMGFRGEALSTISSVANVSLTSRFIEEATGNSISFSEKGRSSVASAAKEKGTSIKVNDLFYNIPARKKYLKSPSTEYRKIYEIVSRYFLVYPNINFVLEKDGKTVLELKEIKGSKVGEISPERVKDVYGEKFSSNSLKVFYSGSGLNINGYISHPSLHSAKSSFMHIYINNRPITDKGIIRAVYEGYSRYLPFGEKIDFVLNLSLNPELVDINVHPRKEEVRFENPFRIYSAIEEAVKHTLEKELSYDNSKQNTSTDFSVLRDTFNQKKPSLPTNSYQPQSTYPPKSSNSVQDSLLFSRELLSTSVQEEPEVKEDLDITKVFQIFNKYIVIEFVNQKLWIVDQHAAAERINFEKLLKSNKENSNLQNLLVPTELSFSKNEILFLEQNQEFFRSLGFIYTLRDNNILIETIPAEFAETDFLKLFEEIFSLEEDLTVLSKNLEKRKDDVLATIACHGSVRSGQKLTTEEMISLFKNLTKCNNPYSCPHGRPAIWKMRIEDIDHNFERTY